MSNSQFMKKMVLLILLLSAALAVARLVPGWSYEKLTKEADLIVIAKPIGVRDTAERSTFPGIATFSGAVPAIGVETTFEILSVLKGRVAPNPISQGDFVSTNYPGLISGKPGERWSSRDIDRMRAARKGELHKLVLHHLRHVDVHGDHVNGPCVVAFSPKSHINFLMFLKQDTDGRYAAATGQTDPCESIRPLGADWGVAMGTAPLRIGNPSAANPTGIFPGPAGLSQGTTPANIGSPSAANPTGIFPGPSGIPGLGYGTPPDVSTNLPPSTPGAGTPQSTPSRLGER